MTTASEGMIGPAGALGLHVVRGGDGASAPVPGPGSPWPTGRILSIAEMATLSTPSRALPGEINAWRRTNARKVAAGLRKIAIARALKLPTFYGSLFLSVIRTDGERLDLGLAGLKMVTTAGVTYLAADIAGGANDSSLFKYHALGTGALTEAITNTALVTELTTQYATSLNRPAGSQSSAAGVYTTIGSNTVTASVAATEHGIFTQPLTGGTLLDATSFTVVNLASGDTLQTTYNFTITAGG